MSETAAEGFYVAWDGEELRWLGGPAGVVRYGEQLGASSLVVWRVDPGRERIERVLAHRSEDVWTLVGPDGRVLMNLEVGAPATPAALEVIDRLSTAGPVVMDRVVPASWPDGQGDGYLRWGFTHPFVGADGRWHAEFCAERIAEQLDDADIDLEARVHYLHGVYLRILLHIEHRHLEPAAAEAHIDSIMYELNPEVLALVSRVQMRALDTGG